MKQFCMIVLANMNLLQGRVHCDGIILSIIWTVEHDELCWHTMGIIWRVKHNELCWHNRDVLYTITENLSLECHLTWLPVFVCHLHHK